MRRIVNRESGYLSLDMVIAATAAVAIVAASLAWYAGAFDRSQAHVKASFAAMQITEFSQALMLGRTCALQMVIAGTPPDPTATLPCTIPSGAPQPIPGTDGYRHGAACAQPSGDSNFQAANASTPYADRRACLFETGWGGLPSLAATPLPARTGTSTAPRLPRRCNTGQPAAVPMSYGLWMPANGIEEAAQIENLIRDGLDQIDRDLDLWFSTNREGILVCM